MLRIARQEIIHSDRFGAGPYVVGLTEDNVAVTCSCIHGRSGNNGKCYHRIRGEKAMPFRRARRAYLRAGAFGGSREAFDARFEELANEVGVDAAIDRVLANAPREPNAPLGAVPDGTCTRCGGPGHFPQFTHVEGGVCFRCRGTGAEPESR